MKTSLHWSTNRRLTRNLFLIKIFNRCERNLIFWLFRPLYYVGKLIALSWFYIWKYEKHHSCTPSPKGATTGVPPHLWGVPPPLRKKKPTIGTLFFAKYPTLGTLFFGPHTQHHFHFPQCFRNCILNGYFNEFRTQDIPKCTKKRHLQLRCGLTSKFERALHFIFI